MWLTHLAGKLGLTVGKRSSPCGPVRPVESPPNSATGQSQGDPRKQGKTDKVFHGLASEVTHQHFHQSAGRTLTLLYWGSVLTGLKFRSRASPGATLETSYYSPPSDRQWFACLPPRPGLSQPGKESEFSLTSPFALFRPPSFLMRPPWWGGQSAFLSLSIHFVVVFLFFQLYWSIVDKVLRYLKCI